MTEIDKQIGKLIDLYQVSGIPLETIQEKMNALNKEKEALLAISKPRNTPQITLSEMICARNTLIALTDSGNLDEKRVDG